MDDLTARIDQEYRKGVKIVSFTEKAAYGRLRRWIKEDFLVCRVETVLSVGLPDVYIANKKEMAQGMVEIKLLKTLKRKMARGEEDRAIVFNDGVELYPARTTISIEPSQLMSFRYIDPIIFAMDDKGHCFIMRLGGYFWNIYERLKTFKKESNGRGKIFLSDLQELLEGVKLVNYENASEEVLKMIKEKKYG